MTAELTYVAVWPILDRTRPIAALITEACRDLDIKAELAGARIIGEPTWTMSTNAEALVCQAPARAWDPDKEADFRGTVSDGQREYIHRLAMNGMSARQIAEKVGVSPTTASRYAKQVR